MRLYLGTAALQVGVGFILGALLGYLVGVAVQRWRNVRELRGVHRIVREQRDRAKADSQSVTVDEGRSAWLRTADSIETELRRRNL